MKNIKLLDEYFDELTKAGYVPPPMKTPKNGADKIFFFVSVLNFTGENSTDKTVQYYGEQIINLILLEIPRYLIMGYFSKFFRDDAKDLTREGWFILIKVMFSEYAYNNSDVLFPTLLLNEFPESLFVMFLKKPGGFRSIVYEGWFWFLGRYFANKPMFVYYSQEQITELMRTGKLKSPVSDVTFNFNDDTIEVIGKDQTIG